GSGLFTAGAALTADPMAAAFHASATVDEALARLAGVLTADERAFLRSFYGRFAARVDPLLAETRARTAPSQALTAATLADTAVGAYLGRVARLFAPVGSGAGADGARAMDALYVWWPDSAQTRASPVGRTLLLRVRPPASDTVNSADVVAHEVVHVLAAEMPPTTQRALGAAVLAGCGASDGPPGGVRRLAVLEEPIATALGNVEFRRRFQPRRFTWGRRWYGDPWVDVYARLLHPVLVERLATGRPLDASFARDAGALCAALGRLPASTGG
ncbi:MAG TPA: hypothetical protein VEZ47_03890, partial [Gemmatirosa sp.]|nr:hypothetical protein [Gemmatirosa sp.]